MVQTLWYKLVKIYANILMYTFLKSLHSKSFLLPCHGVKITLFTLMVFLTIKQQAKNGLNYHLTVAQPMTEKLQPVPLLLF